MDVKACGVQTRAPTAVGPSPSPSECAERCHGRRREDARGPRKPTWKAPSPLAQGQVRPRQTRLLTRPEGHGTEPVVLLAEPREALEKLATMPPGDAHSHHVLLPCPACPPTGV